MLEMARENRMEFEGSYLEDKERIELIKDFILHEIKKIDSDIYTNAEEKIRVRIGDEYSEIFRKFKENIKGDIERAREELKTYNLMHKWRLFHSISYGIIDKELWNCVGWNELNWRKTSLTCFELRFESKRGLLNEMEVEKPLFAEVLKHAQKKSGPYLKEQILSYSKDGPMERQIDPIICRKENDYYLIHDGTGRMLIYCCKIALKEIENSTKITSWVGEKRALNAKEIAIYKAAQKELFYKIEGN